LLENSQINSEKYKNSQVFRYFLNSGKYASLKKENFEQFRASLATHDVVTNLQEKPVIGLGPIALDFPCISEELTDKSN
jgi:hypothetical protein